MSEEEINRKITIIFATDVVGYSKAIENNENRHSRIWKNVGIYLIT